MRLRLRIAWHARVIRVDGTLEFTPAILVFSLEMSDAIVSWFREAAAQVAERLDDNAGEGGHTPAAETALDVVLRLMPVAIMFSRVWLTGMIHEAIAESSETDDEGLETFVVRLPIVGGSTRVIALLDADDAFERDGDEGWDWVAVPAREWSRQGSGDMPETTVDDVSIGYVALQDGTLVMAVNSEESARQGRAMLSSLLGDLARPGSIVHDDASAVLAEQDLWAPPEEPMLGTEDVERLVHACLDEHYRHALDDPSSLPGGGSPRAATGDGRSEVIDWLRKVENTEARRASRHGQRPYNTAWLWRELGIEIPR